MSKKDTVTKIILNKKYKNIVECTDYKITAPDGYSFIHTLCPSGKLKEYIEHTGGTIEPVTQERDKRSISIAGVSLRQPEPNVLEFTSKSRKVAAIRYDKIKKELIKTGYKVKSHRCGQIPKPKPPTRIDCPDTKKLETYT